MSNEKSENTVQAVSARYFQMGLASVQGGRVEREAERAARQTAGQVGDLQVQR